MSDKRSLTYAVAIVHYGDPSLTLKLINSLRYQTALPQSVVVVDNQGMSASTWQEAVDDGTVILRPGANVGYAAGVNLCLQWGHDLGVDALWVLNPDVDLRREAAASFNQQALLLDHWDVLGSIVTRRGLVWFGGGGYSSLTGRAWHEHYGSPATTVTSSVRGATATRTEWINGCSMYINMAGEGARRQFDEHFFLYREELEWQRREPPLRAFVLPIPLVEHEAGAATGGTSSGLGRVFMSRNGWILSQRQRGMRRFLYVAAWFFEFVVVPIRRRDLAGIREAVRGVRMRNMAGPAVLERL